MFFAVLFPAYGVVLAWPHVLDVPRYASVRRQANALYSAKTPRKNGILVFLVAFGLWI